MQVKSLKIAIVSDLHCHPESTIFNENNTLLFSDKLRSPSKEHPVENLLEVIKDENINVDLILSPGDFTHHSNKQGFFSGWSYVNEISRALNAKDIIATIGNHDIDSRHKYSQYSFDIPKKIKQNFPLSPKYLGNFWDTGYTFINEKDYIILVINSTHFHTHFDDKEIDNPAVKGKIDNSQIEEIENYLKINNCDSKIKIALCHHHPIKHARLDLGEHDFIENGENLLTVLGQFKFDLVIHGHKHDPWLRYCSLAGYNMPVLSSGSFSATNQISWINKLNYFHTIEFLKEAGKPSRGKVETWTFKNRVGWKKDKDDGFYPYTGFGYLHGQESIIQKIEALLAVKEMMLWTDVIKSVPELEYLTPEMMDNLEEELQCKKIYLNARIGLKPKHIYYERV